MHYRESTQRAFIFGARLLLGLLFAVSAVTKIAHFNGVAGYMAARGLPLPEVLLTLTILIELGGALALILGWRARQAALGLFLFIIPATLLFHAFWSADAASYQNQLNHFLKNLAIMGGMLYVVVFGPGALSLDERADRS